MTHSPHWPLEHVTSEHCSFGGPSYTHARPVEFGGGGHYKNLHPKLLRLELFRSHSQPALVVFSKIAGRHQYSTRTRGHRLYSYTFIQARSVVVQTMAAKFSGLFLVGFVATMVVIPYMIAEARYLPTRGNEDRLTRLKELLTDLLDSGVQPNLEMERPYVDSIGDYSRIRPREYSVPEKSIMELFNPTAPHHQRPRS